MLNVTSDRLAVGLLFAAIGVLACLAPTQSDTWWHLRSGLDIWHSGKVSLHDTYSYTATGGFWPNHEWLTEVIFYALYRIGGLPLVTGACAALILSAWAVSWRLTQGVFEIRFPLFAACLVSAAGSWAVRPQVFSFAVFALTWVMLVTGRHRWLPALFVVWTNLHGAVALGLVAVGAAFVADVITHRKLSRSLAITLVGCVLATVVSPLGFRLWPEIIASIERSRINRLIEWQTPGFSPGLWPFWAVAILVPLAAAIQWRRLDERALKLVLIALSTLPLALMSVRNVPVFLLAAVPALSVMVAPRDRATRLRGAAGEHVRINAAILGTGVAIAIVIVALAWIAPAPSLGWRPVRPQAAAAITACGQPLYNAYNDGGELIWFVPEQKVFLDNRQDPYPLPLLRASHALELDGNYTELFTQYGIRCAVVAPTSITAQRLRADPAWAVTYADERWMVTRRN